MAFEEQLKALAEQGLTFSDCINHFGTASDTHPYAIAAEEMYAEEGKIEIDDKTIVSDSNGGNYVMAWVWVPESRVTEPA